MNKKVFAMVLILVLALTIFPINVSAGSSTCYRTTCNNQDPIQYVCANDAYTAVFKYASGASGTVESDLRYSSQCVANWARTTNTYPGAVRHLRAELRNSTQNILLESWDNTNTFQGWTLMYDGYYVRCARGYQNFVGYSGWDAVTAYGCG